MQAGTSGSVDVFSSGDTDLVIDISGYFGPLETPGLALFPVTPCRILDTRTAGTMLTATTAVNAATSACALPLAAQALVLNATVLPSGDLGFLTLWPLGAAMPSTSTLNAEDGIVSFNMAIVQTSNGSLNVFGSSPTHLVLDVSGYFGPLNPAQ